MAEVAEPGRAVATEPGARVGPEGRADGRSARRRRPRRSRERHSDPRPPTPAPDRRRTATGAVRHHRGQRRRRDVPGLRRRAGHRRGPDRHRRPGDRAAAQYFTAAPRTRSSAAWDAIWAAYTALFKGAIFDPTTARERHAWRRLRPAVRDADQRDAADPRRPLGRRSPSGPGCSTSARRARSSWARSVAGYVGFAWHLPVVLHLIVARSSAASSAARLGRHRRLAQGADRRARGHHDDHAQLRRALPPRLPAVGPGVPAPAVRSGDLQRRRLQRALPAPARRRCGCTSASSSRWPRPPGVWWLLSRSTLGFELRAVGANQSAARTAGMSVGAHLHRSSMLHRRRPGRAGRHGADPRHQPRDHR